MESDRLYKVLGRREGGKEVRREGGKEGRREGRREGGREGRGFSVISVRITLIPVCEVISGESH